MFTTTELVSRSMALPSFRTRLLTLFAALALVLALAGVYSLMVFHVNQRLLTTALLASSIAARRALAFDPLEIIRAD